MQTFEKSPPRLTVGMPVYNGGDTLEAAVRSVLAQSVKEIEIIISDNGSTDETSVVCARMAALDPRVRFVRQPQTLSIVDNFKFVLNEAKAPYFMWAAHDDVRETDTAEKLIAGLEADSKAILAFGDVIEVRDGQSSVQKFEFDTSHLSPSARLRQTALSQLYHIYGIWRTDAVRKIPWANTSWWVDTPFMMAASQLGNFIYVPGPHFIYRFNPRPFFGWRKKEKSSIGRQFQQFGQSVGQLFLMIGLSYSSVSAVAGRIMGLKALYYATLKILSQIFGFVSRRVFGQKPTLG